MTYITLAILIPGAAAAAIWIGRRAPELLGVLAAVGSLVAALAGVLILGETSGRTQWANYGSLPLVLRFERSSLILSSVVALVAANVFAYALQYMKGKGRRAWFWGAMTLFLSAMQLLVFAGDWITFIIAWEVMGAASYLLIATFFEESDARNGARQAFLYTRLADLGLYFAAFAIFSEYGNLEIRESATQSLSAIGAAGLLLSAMGKAAQVPLQSWLTGAMAGPTPVSALLHSATMVAAGALLLIRSYPILSDAALLALVVIGGSTAILSGISAIASTDLKRILAASTSSQLGFMVFAVGVGSPAAAFAHWIAHALLKSGLFLSAGAFQERYETTSIAKLEGAGRSSKFSYALFILLGLALAGLPPLVGYVSKDGILAAALKAGSLNFSIALFASLLTGAYVGRVVGVLGRRKKPEPAEARSTLMLACVAFAVVLALVGGFALEPIVKSAGYHIPKSSIAKAAGLGVLLVGVALGALLPDRLLANPVASYCRNHYRTAGGYQALIGIPLKAVTKAAGALEPLLSGLVFATGRAALSIAAFLASVDKILRLATTGFGVQSLRLSRASRDALDDRLISMVDGLASSARSSGESLRRWQSGLVHKELFLTASGAAALFFLFIIFVYVS